jgi:carbonic anhydrase/acetyltransferase-like protein (isoleucine patch superfamily)
MKFSTVIIIAIVAVVTSLARFNANSVVIRRAIVENHSELKKNTVVVKKVMNFL